MKPTILVYGWYNQGNIGDELFKEVFRNLFFDFELKFVSRITLESLKDVVAVFIGGGSFLFSEPSMAAGVLDVLQQKKIFYLGVGAETEIHPTNLLLLSQAKLIAIRTPQHLSKIKEINTNTISIPDMVYYLKPYVQKSNVQPNSVLVLPNMAVVPQWQDPHWKHVSWEYFKSEFAQFLDSLVDQKYNVKFLAMCQNNKINDNWAAIEVINKMKNRHSNYVLDTLGCDIKTITSCISGYEFIITQRFHGIVLSELVGRPYLSIYHHDKLKHSLAENGNSVSYYGISKMQMHENLLSVQRTNLSSILPIEDNIFEALREKVINLINDG